MTTISELKKKAQPTIELVNPNNPEDSERVNIDLKLNLKKIMFIARDFPEANDVATLQMGRNGMQLDMIQLFKLVYVAYRMANMNDYLVFEDFCDYYEFDMAEAQSIYMAMLDKEYRNEYLEKITKAAERVERTVKKDNSKLQG